MALSPGFSFDPSAKLPRCTPLSVLPLLRMLPFSTCPESAHSLFQQHDPAGTTFFSSMARFPFLSMSFPRFYIDSQEGDHPDITDGKTFKTFFLKRRRPVPIVGMSQQTIFVLSRKWSNSAPEQSAR